MTLLRGAFAPLRYGDVVLVEYVPIKGTTVRINRGVAVSGAHHDLMLAFLDHWIGQQPVSEEVKRSLLASSGSGSGSDEDPDEDQGSGIRDFSITCAALYPGNPVIFPPGWLLDPHR
jgi:Chalcone isomerase-like